LYLRANERWGPIGILPYFPIDFQVDPRDAMRIFANNYQGGNFLSEDGGRTWSLASIGYTGAELNSIAVSPNNPSIVYANGRSGPFKSVDGGLHWQGINPENLRPILDGKCIIVDPHSPDHVLMSDGQEGVMHLSKDGGKSWVAVMDHWSEIRERGAIQQGIQAIAFAPSVPGKVYGGFGSYPCTRYSEKCEIPVLFSTLTSEDGGRTWAPQERTPLDGLTVTAIVVHLTDADTAWAATAGGGVFRTSDGGVTWEPTYKGLPPMVFALADDPNDPGVLYAGIMRAGVFKSEDGGTSWRQSSVGMDPNEPIVAIAVDPVRPSVVYAGSWQSGVFVSEDGGATWRRINDGLRTRYVRDLTISPNGETLYAATNGEGAFRLSTLSQEQFDALAPAPTPIPPTATPRPAPTAIPRPTLTRGATAPTIAPPPAQPTAPPEVVLTPTPAPSGGRGICGGAAALPLALLGLVWINRRRR
jgi:uncharacterized protein (TIGR03382 family)